MAASPKALRAAIEEWGCKEVATFIGMSRQWVQVHAMSGTIPSFRLSERGRFHFRPREIRQWYAQRMGQAPMRAGGAR
jgi:predicted DNA-binding transcriptional regulator AlpA